MLFCDDNNEMCSGLRGIRYSSYCYRLFFRNYSVARCVRNLSGDGQVSGITASRVRSRLCFGVVTQRPLSSYASMAQSDGKRSLASGQMQESESNAAVGVPQPRLTKKRKVMPPSVQYRVRIQQAAKKHTIDDAFAAFEQAKAENVRLSPDCFVTLLFLAAGGDSWEELVHCREKREEYLKTERLQKCDEILECLVSSGSPMVEMCYTALARRDAILGRGSSALSLANQVTEDTTLSQRLRCYLPALVSFTAAGDAMGAMETYRNIMAAGLEPGEIEFQKIIQALSNSDSTDDITWETVESLLLHMSRETTQLTKETISELSRLFTSQRPPQPWTVETCSVHDDGFCEFCNDKLQAIDLTEEEYEQFSSGIASLAGKQAKQPEDFGTFVEWLKSHGPFGVIIDAANVAFYGQNFDTGGFNFGQIEAVVDRVRRDFPDLKPLVILHINRTKGHLANSQKAKALLTDLTEKNSFYAAPHGSNDDWYWMYAAVAAGQRGLLVSNDEMRDHLFNLLSPKYFDKWKQRHQMRYTFAGDVTTLEFQSPPPYTRCTQHLSNGCWMFPADDGTWLGAKIDG